MNHFVFQETNSLLQQRLEHTDADLNHRLKQAQEVWIVLTVFNIVLCILISFLFFFWAVFYYSKCPKILNTLYHPFLA